MLRNKVLRRKCRIPSKKISKELLLYKFPAIEGYLDISQRLDSSPAENIFGALLHAFALSPIKDERTALKAERILQYLGCAFDEYLPEDIASYQHVLLLLLDEYDKIHHIRAASDIPPHEFLKALLEEDNLLQKSLVPDCFHSESQVSEYLNQKKGRSQLNVKQALALGKKFKVNPLNFLKGG